MGNPKPIEVRSELLPDLVHHFFAHLSFDHISCIHDPDYIAQVARAKVTMGFPEDFRPELLELGKLYSQNRDRLFALDFLPYHCGSLEDFHSLVDRMIRQDNEGVRVFMDGFWRILDRELPFYARYREQREAESSPATEAFLALLADPDSPLGFFNRLFAENLVVFRSQSLRRFGRGVDRSGGRVLVSVKSPESRDEAIASTLTAMHELTHFLTYDPGEEGDDSLGMAGPDEVMVMLYDYRLLRDRYPAYLGPYLALMSGWLGREITPGRIEGELALEGPHLRRLDESYAAGLAGVPLA